MEKISREPKPEKVIVLYGNFILFGWTKERFLPEKPPRMKHETKYESRYRDRGSIKTCPDSPMKLGQIHMPRYPVIIAFCGTILTSAKL